jgi:Rrf2 family iron-sulfur cluster assembly transcriptional regulator
VISKSGIQALNAVAVLAELPEGTHLGAAQLARRTGAPENYLGKLLHILARRRLLASQKGFGGGFRLAKPAGSIALMDILQHLEPVERWSGCIMGREECSDHESCALHRQWKGIRDAYLKFLRETSIGDILDRKRRGRKLGHPSLVESLRR